MEGEDGRIVDSQWGNYRRVQSERCWENCKMSTPNHTYYETHVVQREERETVRWGEEEVSVYANVRECIGGWMRSRNS